MAQKQSRRVQFIGVLALLTGLLPAGLAKAQEKKDQPPVTSSRSFQLSGYTQFLYTYWDKGVDTASIPRARLTLSSEIVKNIRFKIQVDAVKSPALIDAQLDFLLKPYLTLRVGQYYVPFSSENTTSDSDLDLVQRSQVVNSLAPSRDIGSQGRDIGVSVTGKYSVLEYQAGVFNGAGINKADTNKWKDLSGRLVIRPAKFISVGGSLYSGHHSQNETAPLVARDRAGLEAALTLGEFYLKGEYIAGKDGQTSRDGWFIQGSFYFLPKKLQAVARWDTYDPNGDITLDRADIMTLGANWYLLNRTKLALNYNLYRREGEGTTNWALFVQFQAGF